MQGSIERVRAVIHGEMPDRAPLYDLLRNDAVLNHFTGRTLTVENAHEVVYAAFEPAIDATRPLVRLPKHEETVILEDGRQQRFFRWTIWTERVRYESSEAYAAAKRQESWTPTIRPGPRSGRAAMDAAPGLYRRGTGAPGRGLLLSRRAGDGPARDHGRGRAGAAFPTIWPTAPA